MLDEDPDQLDTLAALIEDLGYESIRTSDPDEALKCVRDGRSRLLLADLSDAGLYGYEFLDRVLRADPGVHVIVMTRRIHAGVRARGDSPGRERFSAEAGRSHRV